MGERKTLKIGNVVLENNLGADGRGLCPAISCALQGTRSGACLHGDGQRQRHLLSQ